ncbi:MAG TPA: Xaa-Pro peptidase family protein [Acidimicrobiales bacterium]|nr:Xaa-Pro peptidase family protein [Acidimicrobiales bacterium]
MNPPSDTPAQSAPEVAVPVDAEAVVRSFAERMDRVRRAMSEHGMKALLVSNGGDLPWLTGYAAMPLERITMLVVRKDEPPVLLVPALEEPRVTRCGDLFEVRPWLDTDDPLDLVSAMVGRGGAGQVGLSDQAWAKTLLGLQARLPKTTLVSASAVTAPLRAVKDDLEVAMLAKAASAADRVASAIQASEVRFVGRTEAEVAGEIARRLLAEGHARVDFTIVGSGPNGASPHHDSSERVIGAGETVVCDFGGQVLVPGTAVGYCSDITRTVVTGQASDEVAECYAVLRAAQEAAVLAAVAGVAAEEVDRVARSVIEDAGLGEAFVHRTGHGIGIETHEEPYIVAGNAEPLVAGNAFSVEPGIYHAHRFGMRLEDIVVVTPTGPRRLNHASHDLVSLER